MLIDKGISVGEVITMKLASGEEVVAKLVEETPEFYKVAKPMVIGMGQQGPGLMPFLFTVHPDKELTVYKKSISVVAATDKQFADQFIQSTTGIKLI